MPPNHFSQPANFYSAYFIENWVLRGHIRRRSFTIYGIIFARHFSLLFEHHCNTSTVQLQYLHFHSFVSTVNIIFDYGCPFCNSVVTRCIPVPHHRSHLSNFDCAHLQLKQISILSSLLCPAAFFPLLANEITYDARSRVIFLSELSRFSSLIYLLILERVFIRLVSDFIQRIIC